MIFEVTIYRCYWPQVFAYLKQHAYSFKSEAFGLLATISLSNESAYRFVGQTLPVGAIVDGFKMDVV